jgi:hypothetical protein
MKEIHVLGWYDTPTSETLKCNIGDEAYKLAFPKLFPNNQFIFCDTLKDLDPEIVILGGGDVLYPSFINKIKASKARKKYAFSINVTPDIEPIFDRVISRNRLNNFEYLPDFVFALEGNKDHGKAIIKRLFDQNRCELYENVVILVMNSFLCTRENTLARDKVNFEKVCFELALIMDTTPASFILLPFGNGFPHNDKVTNACVYSKCKHWKKNLLVFDSLSVQETLDVFAGADASINTRLHSNIFSCISGIPFIDIGHHDKTRMFMESVNKLKWRFNYWHFPFGEIKNLLNAFLSNKELYKNESAQININNKKLLGQLSVNFDI